MNNEKKMIANPRHSACELLLRVQTEGCYADRLMDVELDKGNLAGPDRGLFAELVFGVLRRQGTLDHILAGFLTKSLESMEPLALIILRVGLYQLVYLDRIPESAAVNESVNLAKEQLPRVSGMINAVLRNYLRNRSTITFPDLAIDPIGSITLNHSHPEWLVRRWVGQLGVAAANKIAAAFSTQPPLVLRVNRLQISRDEFLRRLKDNGIDAQATKFSPEGVLLATRHNITGLPGFREGWFAVQDESSQMASILLDPQPGELLLDCCAAPGGKAVHLAELMQNQGELWAVDISRSRLPLVQEAAKRLGINIIRTYAADLAKPGLAHDRLFDRILLDAPCSGLGVIRRNPETKWRLTPSDVTRLATSQLSLLENCSKLLKPDGRILYSTCSTMQEENEKVIDDFLARHPEYILEDLNKLFPKYDELFNRAGHYRAWPHLHNMDGFFAARLRRVNI